MAAMNLQDFRNSIAADAPPADMSPALAGLWWDLKGDWTRAHDAVNEEENAAAAWVHAYLHRKHGDTSNAAYWYEHVRKPASTKPFNEEWEEIARSLLG
jgi:hypothetical protein